MRNTALGHRVVEKVMVGVLAPEPASLLKTRVTQSRDREGMKWG